MPRYPFGKQIELAQVMLAGIKSHKEELALRGITDEYIEKFSALTEMCTGLNNKQEKAKADMKDATSKLNVEIKKLEKEIQYCKRVVITDIPKTLWREFGVEYRNKKSGSTEPQEPQEPEEPQEAE